MPRLRRQVFELCDTRGWPTPAWHRLINRLALGYFVRPHGKQIHHLSSAQVMRAQLHLFEPIQDIKLGYAKACEAIDLGAAFEQCSVKPPATP